MGDERTYDYAIALRAVTTTDFMTAEGHHPAHRDHHHAANRIVIKNINRVMFATRLNNLKSLIIIAVTINFEALIVV